MIAKKVLTVFTVSLTEVIQWIDFVHLFILPSQKEYPNVSHCSFSKSVNDSKMIVFFFSLL